MRKKSVPDATRVELDQEIARYEAMSDDEVNAELALYGIDPQPTIDAVTDLVKARLEERDRRLLHHPEAVVAVGVVVLAVCAMSMRYRRGARV